MKWVLLMLGLFVAMPVAFFVALNLLTSDEKTDCSRLRDPTPELWQSADFDTRSGVVTDLSLCRRLQGRTQAEVEALLGPPTEVFAGGQSYRLFKDSAGAPDKWIVYFDADRRVRDTRRISAGYPG